MRIAVVGAGAMGSLYAGLLARAGADVHLIGRSRAHVDAIASDGLRMTQQDVVDHRIELRATTAADTIGPVDVVLLLTKAHQLADAARSAAPLFSAKTMACCLQNGLGIREEVTAVLPDIRLVVGVSEIGADLIAPGHIEVTANVFSGQGETSIGASNAADCDAAERIAATFRAAGIVTRVVDDVERLIWLKCALAGTMSTITAIARLRFGPVTGHPAGWPLIDAMFTEIVAVANAAGVDLDLDQLRARARATYQSVPHHIASMAADHRAARPTERAYLTGAVIERASAFGIDVPVTRTLDAMLQLIEDNYQRRLP